MLIETILILALVGTMPETIPEPTVICLVLHTYEARIRLDGRVSTTEVKASDAGQAKKLVQQQFPNATVLSVKKID